MAYRKFSPTRQDHYQDVTDKIVEALEAGIVPWRKGWDNARCGAPFNATTKKAYRGINTLLLSLIQMVRGHDDPRWCSYRQAAARGWQVRKGEHGTRVYFYKQIVQRSADGSTSDNDSGNTDRRNAFPLLRAYTVFHASQIDGIPEYVPPERGALPWQKPEAVQTILDNSGVPVHTGGTRACYIPSRDVIHMPPAEAFGRVDDWASTALHELAHATGHPSRLNRDLSGTFGSASYALEEAKVESAASMVCDVLGIHVDYTNHASYIAGWVSAMRENKRAIFRIATDAQKIADYVLDLHPDYVASGHDEAADDSEGGEDRAAEVR